MICHPIDLRLLKERYFLDNPRETRDFLRQFVDVLGNLANKLGRAIAAGDETDMRFYAHAAKGSAGNATAMIVARFAEMLEQATDPVDWPWAQDVLSELRDALTAVKSFVEALDMELQS